MNIADLYNIFERVRRQAGLLCERNNLKWLFQNINRVLSIMLAMVPALALCTTCNGSLEDVTSTFQYFLSLCSGVGLIEDLFLLTGFHKSIKYNERGFGN